MIKLNSPEHQDTSRSRNWAAVTIAETDCRQPDLTAVGAIEPRDQMQQRALAAAGFSGQRVRASRLRHRVDAAQHVDLLAGGTIRLGQVADAEHDLVAGCQPGVRDGLQRLLVFQHELVVRYLPDGIPPRRADPRDCAGNRLRRRA